MLEVVDSGWGVDIGWGQDASAPHLRVPYDRVAQAGSHPGQRRSRMHTKGWTDDVLQTCLRGQDGTCGVASAPMSTILAKALTRSVLRDCRAAYWHGNLHHMKL